MRRVLLILGAAGTMLAEVRRDDEGATEPGKAYINESLAKCVRD